MKFNYQYGFDFFGIRILWITVSIERFKKKVTPMILDPGQLHTVSAEEIIPMFNDDFILRHGWRLYRGVSVFSGDFSRDENKVE